MPTQGKAARRASQWRKLVVFLTIGYYSMGRSFSYIGIIPASIFIGEIVLAWFALTRQDAIAFFFAGARRNRSVELIRATLLLFFGYGILTLVNGLLRHQNPFAAAQNLAFNYYAFYLIIGVWVAVKNPPFMKTLAISFGWFHAIYGTAYVLLFQRFDWYVPGTPMVQWFGQPNGAAVAILLMLSYERRFRRIFWPMMLNLFVMLAVQVRSEWIGFVIAFIVWSVLAKKISQFVGFVGVTVLLCAVALFFNLHMEGIANRGGEVSVQGVVGRMIAPFDATLAAKFVDDPESLGGTAKWRQEWWNQIWLSINHGDQKTFLFGHGYGYVIADLAGYVEEDLRSPHNIFFYSLCYGGWCGAFVFAIFQLSLLYALYRAYRLSGQAFGIAFWIVNVTMALLGNEFETPFGAIPYFLLVGLHLRPLFENAVMRARNKAIEKMQDRGYRMPPQPYPQSYPQPYSQQPVPAFRQLN